jgi:cupin superfamily acireductone dioxygenase involved in methionine salvage
MVDVEWALYARLCLTLKFVADWAKRDAGRGTSWDSKSSGVNAHQLKQRRGFKSEDEVWMCEKEAKTVAMTGQTMM